MIDLNDLRLFVHVCENQGVARAARALGLPKSSISRRVAELERRLGAELLRRSARHFSLTELGSSLYQHGIGMMSVVAKAEELLDLRTSEVSGLVRLSTSIAFGQLIVPGLLIHLAARHPNLRMLVEVANRSVDSPSGAFDVLLRAHTWPLTDSSLVQRRIGVVPMLLVASPDYLARAGAPTQLDELAAMAVLPFGFQEEVTSWLFTDSAGERRIVAFRPKLQISDMVTLRLMALAAVGIAQLPEYLCRRDLRTPLKCTP